MRERKRQFADSEKELRSAVVMRRLEAEPHFAAAQTVLFYWAMADEVQTQAAVQKASEHKTVLLPCVDGDDLRLRQYTGTSSMAVGEQFGIGEPVGDEFTDLEKIDVVVVPGVAFDRDYNRMGRGRGYYDRLLRRMPHAFTIGVAYGFQMVDHVPTDDHDIALNLVISD
ncbi:MAG: 5-formyltetrahydrofolate cyclo-ligase [Bacteroidales bacterium]|nr:5-formyltetrahydrofolate cyclo-ligase [Bacteroidales bacterium]